MFAGALDLALGDSMTRNARAVMQLIFNIATGLAVVICFATAVFYAGAMSSALVVRKTLVFGATVGFLLFLSAVVEIYVAHSLMHALHVSDASQARYSARSSASHFIPSSIASNIS